MVITHHAAAQAELAQQRQVHHDQGDQDEITQIGRLKK
jgi:hypothetical protein